MTNTYYNQYENIAIRINRSTNAIKVYPYNAGVIDKNNPSVLTALGSELHDEASETLGVNLEDYSVERVENSMSMPT